MRVVLACLFVLGCIGNGHAQSRYTPPEGCEALATLRLPNCIVRHVSSCPSGNIADGFVEGRYAGRAYYANPALFLRYEGTDGYVAGHTYGAGTPSRSEALGPGQIFTYTRSVYRNAGEPKPGDEGTEVMEVGRLGSFEMGGRPYTVRDIRFEVTNDQGFRYVERALMLASPVLTLGVTATTYKVDGSVESTANTLPEAISLPGDPDFLGFDPAPSCLPSS